MQVVSYLAAVVGCDAVCTSRQLAAECLPDALHEALRGVVTKDLTKPQGHCRQSRTHTSVQAGSGALLTGRQEKHGTSFQADS